MEYGYLAHHGIKGQKWGVRRYQNPDGSLTDAGRRREARSYQKKLNKLDNRLRNDVITSSNLRYGIENQNRKILKNKDNYELTSKDRYKNRLEKSNKKMQNYSAVKKVIDNDAKLAVSEMNKILKQAQREGYTYKTSKLEFAPAHSWREAKRIVNENKNLDIKDMKSILRGSALKTTQAYASNGFSYNFSNTASGNRFKVKDASQLSEKRKRAYKRNQKINSYRPQTVIYS